MAENNRATAPTRNAAATMRSLLHRSSRVPTVAIPARTPTPPAPIRFEYDPTPSWNWSRNTTAATVRMMPCPIESIEIEVIGPIARGVRTSVVTPSANCAATRWSWRRSSSGASGIVIGARFDRRRVAIHDDASHPHAAASTTGPPPSASATKKPVSSESVPPMVASEFAISRSSLGTSRGTTAEAAEREKRLIEITARAPA